MSRHNRKREVSPSSSTIRRLSMPPEKISPTSEGLRIRWPQAQSRGQPLYTVVYVIDVNADDAKEAAELTHQIMTDPESMPPVLHVLDHKGSIQRIDLSSK